MPPTALTSNPSRFLAPFGPQPASPQLQCPIHHGFLLLLDFHMLPAASTSNPSRFLAPFGPLPASPQLQRPIHHGFLLLLDFCHASRSFNVQCVTLSCSFWTSACFPAALTSNPSRFLAPFGLPHASHSFNVQSVTLSCSFWTSTCFPQLQHPIHHAFLLLLDFHMLPAASTSNPPRFLAPFGLPHASRSFNVQSVTLSCSFWTSACFHAALTSNPPRFLAPFGLLPCLPQLQRPIRHVSKPHLPPHNHKLLTTKKSNTSTSVPALLYIF